MSSTSLKIELADYIYQYLCHEAQFSDLPEAARESLTAASECIEQAYKLNTNSTNASTNKHQQHHQPQHELLRIFTRHKEQQQQHQKDPIKTKYSLRNENESSSSSHHHHHAEKPKPDIRVNSHPLASNINDSHNTTGGGGGGISNLNSPQLNSSSNNNNNNSGVQASGASCNVSGQQQQHNLLQQQQDKHQQKQLQEQTKQHSQHPISQLPMTTRKKLSHLRAQIKRQASKAARSRLEKRCSVSGVAGSSGGHGHHLGHMLGMSLDAGNETSSGSRHAPGDVYNLKEAGSQSNSHSLDSPNAYLNNPSTLNSSGPGGSGAGAGSSDARGPGGGTGMAGGGDLDSGVNSNLSPGQHNESGASQSGSKHSNLIPGHSMGVSVHHKNFKQKLIALIKKFRTDGSDFDSEEQYREALERELMKAAAGRGSRAIEELLEEDIDVEGESGSEPEDWDNISESSTPKPSLRPFFSSTTLDKI